MLCAGRQRVDLLFGLAPSRAGSLPQGDLCLLREGRSKDRSLRQLLRWAGQ